MICSHRHEGRPVASHMTETGGCIPIQSLVDLILLPFEVLKILHPLKEADSHSTCIGKPGIN